MSTAKLFNKLLDQTKTDARRIRELEAQLALATQDKNRAVDATAAFWRKRVDEVDQQLVETRERLVAAQEEHAILHTRLDQEVFVNKELVTRLAENETQMSALQPQLLLLEQQKTDLERLCDKVRDRMRRKEQEEERAILNRKAIASVVPQYNRVRR